MRYHRVLFWLAWALLLYLHFKLSHAAIVSRGHPPLPPEDFTALFIAPLFVGLPAAFGDRNTRMRGVLIFSMGFAAIYAFAFLNLNSPRPHIGHPDGIYGIIQVGYIAYFVTVVTLYPPVLIAIFFLERVTGDIVHGIVSRLGVLAPRNDGSKRG